jgi:hypothetical protein
MANTRFTDEVVEDRPIVSAHFPSDERTVFTEDGNADAWIASDTTVVPSR